MKARKKMPSITQRERIERFVKRARIERVAQTAGVLNPFVGKYVADLEAAIQELLRSPDSVVPLRRLAYVTGNLRHYVTMVERDIASYGPSAEEKAEAAQ